MIERYSRKEMAEIWTERRKYLRWLEVELAVCAELAKQGVIPEKDWRALRRSGKALVAEGGVDPDRVAEHEKVTRHDVIAFTTAVAEKVGPVSRYVHFGLTSSDVIDTAFALVVREAGALLVSGIQSLRAELKSKALEHRDLPTIGRSHGIFAEPTSFGLKFLGWYTEWSRNLERLERAIDGMSYGKLSGAVGVNAHWAPAFEEQVLNRLKLKREPVSTQVIPRDRYADYMNALAACGNTLERMSVELRHLQRSEVGEVMEGFKKGQKGSSAMPHKRNPISSENLTGAARLLRGYADSCMENVALWHERDISHSSVERVAFPDASILLDYALNRMTGVIRDLVVRKDRVRENLEKAGTTVFSGHFLLELVKGGASREEAYYWVQECALKTLEGQGSFTSNLKSHEKIRGYLSEKQIEKLGSLEHQLRHVGKIYQSVLGRASASSSR